MLVVCGMASVTLGVVAAARKPSSGQSCTFGRRLLPQVAWPCPVAPSSTSLSFLSLGVARPSPVSRRDEPPAEKSTLIPGNNCP